MANIKKSPVNLLLASKDERQKFIDSFDYIFTDCDGNTSIVQWVLSLYVYTNCFNITIQGTVWDIGAPFVGTDKAITALQEIGKKIVYVSNNTTRSAASYDQMFKASNFNATYVSVFK